MLYLYSKHGEILKVKKAYFFWSRSSSIWQARLISQSLTQLSKPPIQKHHKMLKILDCCVSASRQQISKNNAGKQYKFCDNTRTKKREILMKKWKHFFQIQHHTRSVQSYEYKIFKIRSKRKLCGELWECYFDKNTRMKSY